ncbi:MAG: DUF805 domain-containing protein [Anaerolineae bacterium]
MNWYLKVFKQYFDFRGRARRKEYWPFTLINAVILGIFMLLDFVIFGANFETGEGIILYPLYAIITFIPGLAVAIRRLHDTGKHGWYLFTAFVPFIGIFILIYYLAQDSERDSNRWGANPKKPEKVMIGQMA